MSERDLWICERCGREAQGEKGEHPVSWRHLEGNDICAQCWDDFRRWWGEGWLNQKEGTP